MAVTNSQIRIITKNVVDISTLTATPALDNVAAMPVTNLQNTNRTEFFRSTAIDAVGVTISGELTGSELVSAAVLDGHNLKVGDTYQVKVWTGPGKTGVLFDTGWLEAFAPKSLGDLVWGFDPLASTVFDDRDWVSSQAWFGSTVVARSYEVNIISEGNADGFIDVNRLVLGRAISPARNFRYGYELNHWTSATHEMSEAGSSRVEPGHVRRVISVQLPRILDTERSDFADFLRSAAPFATLYISLFPEQGGKLERDHSMVCILNNQASLKNLNSNRHTIDLIFKEI